MYRTGQVAAQLNISPATLRRLSERYSRWLSTSASAPERLENGRQGNRSYSESDVALLVLVQQLKESGMSDEEIEAQVEREQDGVEILAPGEQEGEAWLAPANATALGLALRQLAETQQALVVSEQASRELLTELMNNALKLKDENDRLRKRLRTIEEETARLKESDWNHRLALEERMSQLERQAEAEKKGSWWNRFLGK